MHRERHPEYVEGCFNCKLLTVGISATATPSRSGPVVAKVQSDKAFGRDGDAYKRLRKQGLQPRQIDGSAELEARAESRVEVESGKILTPRKKRQLEAITNNSVDRMKVHEPGGVVAS